MERGSMKRKHGVGHTCITWAEEDVEQAVETLATLGYRGVEIFGWTLDRLKGEGKLDLFERSQIALTSVYFAMNLCRREKFADSVEMGRRWGGMMKRLGAGYVCMGGEDVDRRTFCFREMREQIVSTVNEYGKIFSDMGLIVCYHPHTGTPIQKEEEIRFLLEHVDPEYISFAPDVAQIQKGGADPVKLVRDYLEMVRHIHLKDYDGIPVRYGDGREKDSSGFACYTPLGEGVVNLKEILRLVENSDTFDNLIMVELDGGKQTPIPQEEAVRRNRDYMKRLGYQF